MSLWGDAHAASTNKPKFLPEDENSDYSRADSYATQAGWVFRAGTSASGNSNTSLEKIKNEIKNEKNLSSTYFNPYFFMW